MNSVPQVSIIVPVYNTEQYLEACIDSLIAQTCKDIEIVLVDDGSTDRSGNICDTFAKKDERIKVVHQENQGLVHTWINGTRKSSGTYLCYVDSDDWVESEMIETMLGQSTGNPYEMICSNILCDFPNRWVVEKNQLPAGIYEGDELKEIQQTRLLGNDVRTILFSRCTKLIARKLVEDNIKYSDPKLKMGEDLNIMLPAMIDCKRMVVMDRAFYHYRQFETSMVHVYNPKLHSEVKQLVDIIEKVLIEKKVADAKHLANGEYIILLILVVKNELRWNEKYIEELQNLFSERHMKQILAEETVHVREKAKQLIYFGMKHPNKIVWIILRKLMQLKGAF